MNFNKMVNDQTLAGKRREQMKKLMGNAVDRPGLSYPSGSGSRVVVWRGQQLADNMMPPLQVVHEILWELYELSFPYELLALDWRLSRDHDQHNINACFPGRSSGGLTLISPSVASNGLVANNWHTHLHYVFALVQVMRNWNIPSNIFPPIFRIVESRPELITEQQVLRLERTAAYFYVQHFFDHFGHTPIVPHRLN